MSGWLIDKSAHTRLARSVDPELWANRIERGLVRITSATRLEMGYSARTADDPRNEITSPPLAWMPVDYLTPAIEDRAMGVQLLLAERGHHRALPARVEGPLPTRRIVATASTSPSNFNRRSCGSCRCRCLRS